MTKQIVLMPPNWLGDVVLAQPALRAITTQHKDAKTLVFGRGWLPELLPFLNLEHASVQFVSELPKKSDAVFLFPNSLRSAWQAWKSGAKQRIGFRKDGRSLLLTHGYNPRIDLITQHHLFYYLDLLQQYGLQTPFEEVELVAPDDAKTKAQILLLNKGLDINKVVCVAPGAQFGGAKRYPGESYAVVLEHLSAQGWHIVVLGTDAERDIATQCLQHITNSCWNAAGETSLTEALQLVSVAKLMLCNDSGLMHVAAGLGVPTVTMFGATNPARTSPSGKRVQVLYKPAKCSPCLQRECDVQDHPCMGNILPEHVIQACDDFLNV
ncbi:MAG TPA: lipopolysaccharide heptosyltransferase II [Mariprofundaceae bacterium]|nr:lipopolysaccharide heptosyltransferase II [Mariprofundaceae bacterium]